MKVSMRLMNAGDGGRYFFESVVVGDGDRELSRPLTRNCADAHCSPDQWIRSGIASLHLTLGVGHTVTCTNNLMVS